ncbi:MAG TPA: hypothetical protein PK079_08090 [Leptospiraceae bacterium]|nr:hypothetical protein [Leptospiraceae bacterium]HMW08631.1 hypothetical protein [Leptospiraceae bacterium]HMX35363.1 hypothetical protein [Leptospiraceae bacterium]HMY32418.1 hypothetical protein [Leptospiraceae bacterium]HMZ64173.1 hypothetical protein [Leptospiraceae bacterium]
MSLQAYKFEAIVFQDGIIHIQQMLELANQDIEFFILVKHKPSNQNKPQEVDLFYKNGQAP